MQSNHWLTGIVARMQRTTRRLGRRRKRGAHLANKLLRVEHLEERTLLARVLGSSPPPGAPQVDTGTEIAVYFDGPMDEATFTGDNVTVVGSESGDHTAELRYWADEFELAIDPSNGFAHDETVTVTLTTGVTGGDGAPLAADYSFSFHTLRGASVWEIAPPPSVLATSPVDGGPKLDPATGIELVFGVAMNEATLVAPNIVIEGETSGEHGYTCHYDAASLTATLDPNTNFAFSELVTVTVTTGVRGADGQALPAPYSFSFRTRQADPVETDTPEVLATSPVQGGPRLSCDTPIEIYFNTPMNKATFTADTITIVGSRSGSHTGRFTYQADELALFIDPDTDFAYDESVAVTVTTGVTDDDGDPLASPYSFSFRTVARWTETDTPDVLATSPVQGGPMVALDTPIEIYFNTPMDQATFTADTITIVGSSSGPHTGEFTYQADQLALFINPDADFVCDELVTVTVTIGVADDDGDPLASAYSFSFQTRPAVVMPQIIPGQTITTEVTWTAAGGPYYVTGVIVVASNGVLTIEAGTVVKFNPGTYLRVDGELNVQGTADNRVVFTSYRDDQYGGDANDDGPSSGVRGDWYYLALYNTDANVTQSIIRYAGGGGQFGVYVGNAARLEFRENVLEYCGTPYSGNWHGGIFVVQGANPLIEDNVIRGGSGHWADMGIAVDTDSEATIRGNTIIGHYRGFLSDSTTPDLENNLITGANYAVYTNGGVVRGNDLRNSSYAIYQGPRSDSVIQANTFTAITNHVIGLEGTLESDFVWEDVQGMGWAYLAIVPVVIPSNRRLTIPAGTVVKFNPGTYLHANGILDVQGTTDNRVVFTSYRDDQYGGDSNGDGPSGGARGDWHTVNLQNSSIVFAHSIVRYGYGGQGGQGLLAIASTAVMRDNVVEYCGIGVQQGSNPRVENNVVRGVRAHGDSGIWVSGDSHATVLGNTIIGHYWGLNSDSTNVDLESNTITGANYAVYTNGGAVRGNDIRNSSYALYQGPRSASGFEANTFAAMTNHVIGVFGTLESDFAWDDVQGMGWAYLAIQPVGIPSNRRLTIPAGTVVKFNPGTYLHADGILDVQGTTDNRAVFTSYRDDQYGGDSNGDGPSSGARGDWSHINLRNSSITFEHSIVRYADLSASNASRPVIRDNVLEHCGIVAQEGSNPLIRDNIVRGIKAQGTMGVRVTADSDARVLGNTIIGHYWGLHSDSTNVDLESNLITGAEYAVYTNGGAVGNNDLRNSSYALYQGHRLDPVYAGNTFTNITNHVVAVQGTLKSDFVWEDVQGMGWTYLALGPVIVPSSRRLTIPAETIVKFNGGTYLQADGILDVQGTADDRVVFTSWRDDQYGGDSNGDGPSRGVQGDWYHLLLYSNGANVTQSIIRYSGGGDRFGVYLGNAARPEFRDNVIEYCGSPYYGSWHGGILVWQGANPLIENNVIRGGSGHGADMGIAVNTDSDATILGNTVLGHYYGLYSESTHVQLEGNLIAGATYAVYTNGGVVRGNDLRNSRYALYQGYRSDSVIEANTLTAINYHVTGVRGALEADFVWEDVQGMGWAYLVLEDLTVSGGTRLTIDPGIVVKFEASRDLIVNGTLELRSTPGEEAVFTSFKDDMYGGDSNRDGAASLPAAGNWGAIEFRNPDNHLHDAIIRYGGLSERGAQAVSVAGSAPGTFRAEAVVIENVNGSAVTGSNAAAQLDLDWVTVNNAGSDGVSIQAGQAMIEYCTFNQFGHAGVYVTGGTAVTAIHCNFVDVERNRGVMNQVAGLTVHAEGSWWDDEAGPSVGVPVSGNVAYQPWSRTMITAEVDDGPTIVSRPYLYAVVGRRYAYDADGRPTAVGDPPITWSKVYGPPGFIIDDETGEILWVPTSPGRYLIGIQATDGVGPDTQLFQVVVDNAADIDPPAVSAFSYELRGSPGPVSAELEVTFDEPVLVDAGDIFLLDEHDEPVMWDAYTYSQADCRLTITASGLSSSRTYRLLLLDTITDRTYNPLDGEFDGYTFPSGDGLAGGEFVAPLPQTLQVTEFRAAATGFTARFGREFEPSALNLYDSAAQTLGAADVTLVGAAQGAVRGSLWVSPDRRQIRFVKTGGPLAPDTYTVTLLSGASHFRDTQGGALDGNKDGTAGDDSVTTFVVLPPPAGAVVVTLPDFVRGAGQPVNVPNAAAGLPIRLSDATGVTSLAVDLVYDQNLLQITAATLAAGLPGDWSVTLDPGTPGIAKIRAAGTTPLSGTNIDVVRLTAAVPNAAAYGAIQAIRLENVSLNGGAIAAVGDVPVHKAVYLGDADGSGIHSSADAFLTVQAALGLASGLAAHAWTDPLIVADADGSGVLSAADAFLIVQEGLGLSEPFVPDNPHVTITPVGGGCDPQFQIDVNLPASAGGLVSVPVKLAIEPAATNVGAFDFDLFFDPSRLTNLLPGGISAGADTAGWAVSAILVAPGQLRVGMVSSRGQPLAPGLREIARLQFHVAASLRDAVPVSERPGYVAVLDIEPADRHAGGYAWTAVDGSVASGANTPPRTPETSAAKRRAAADGEPSSHQLRDRLFGDLATEILPLAAALDDLAGDMANAWR